MKTRSRAKAAENAAKRDEDDILADLQELSLVGGSSNLSTSESDIEDCEIPTALAVESLVMLTQARDEGQLRLTSHYMTIPSLCPVWIPYPVSFSHVSSLIGQF